jgi:hypothetical protein
MTVMPQEDDLVESAHDDWAGTIVRADQQMGVVAVRIDEPRQSMWTRGDVFPFFADEVEIIMRGDL